MGDYSGAPPSGKDQHCVKDERRKHIQIYYDHLDLWADADTGLNPSALAVYVCLVRHAGWSDHECFPSLDTIAKQMRMSRPTVVKAVKALKAAGLIAVRKQRVPGGFERSIYTLLDAPKPARSGQERNFTEGERNLQARSKNETGPGKESLLELEPREQESKDVTEKKSSRTLAPDERIVDVWAHECNGGRWPVRPATDRAHAKKLVAAGFDEDEARELIAWLRTQDWRKSGITLGLMENQADNFRAAMLEGKTPARKANKDGGMVYG